MAEKRRFDLTFFERGHPSRPKIIASERRKVCARRSRLASAQALFGQPDRLVLSCKRSELRHDCRHRAVDGSLMMTTPLMRLVDKAQPFGLPGSGCLMPASPHCIV